ncbi:hypothetical protein P7524_13990, partial [Staphylococcus aureus]|nr:hypothetical protein [Staphylococcus aureus]
MPTLYELKQSLGMIGQQLKNKNDELSQKATDPNIDMEDIKQLETEKAGLQQRFNIVERQESSPDSCVKCYTMFLPFLLIKIDVFS